MKKVILWIWQLPQNILGLILSLTACGRARFDSYTVYYTKAIPASVCLGHYLLLTREDSVTLMHEYGHHKQSLMFGWLYLIVVGIPSVCRNIYDRIAHRKWDYAKRVKWYYGSFPEKQADEANGQPSD